MATLVGLALVVGVLVPAPGWSQEDQPSETETPEESAGVPDGPPDGFVPGVDDVPQPGEEILGHTVYSRWWRKASGTIGRESFTRPHFFQDAEGVWREIDTTLNATGEGWWVPVALPTSGARVAETMDGSSVAIELGEPLRRVRVRYPEATGASGTIGEDGRVHFATAFEAGELVVGVSADGWKDTLVVTDASRSGYQVEFELPVGATARDDGRGGVEFVDVVGHTILVYGDGAMAWDSTAPFPAEAPVAVTLVGQSGQRATVQVAVARAWLEDPVRVFPVTIDPIGTYSFTSGDNSQCTTSPNTFTACDTYVNSDVFDGAFWQQTQLRVGSYCCGYEQGTTLNRRARTFLLFPTDNYNSPPHTVKTATLTLFAEDDSGDGTADRYRLYGLGNYPTRNTTWANPPPTSGGEINSLYAAGSSKNYIWNATSLVNDWFRGTRTNYGMRIDAYPNEREITAGRKFSSSEHSSLPAPRLFAEYYNYPSAPGTPAITAGAASVTATWAASSDDGGGTISYEVQLRTSGGSLVASTTRCETCTRSHTFTGLTNGQAYNVRVRATNESGSSSWKTSSNATPDGTNPTTPTLSSSTHTSQTAWSTSDDPCFAWSSSDPETGITGYSYVLDQISATTPDTTSNGTGTSTCYSGKADGEWWFHVRARNGRTNNNMWGSAAHYRVRIDDTAPAAPAVSSSSHPDQATWYPADDVSVSWSASDVSGINGYSWVLDQVPGTTPDTISEGTATSTSSSDLADGVWYFHVRARNGSGLWSSAAHFTIRVDDTAPSVSSLSSTSHPSQDTWSTDNDPTFTWTASDTSGIAGYSYSFDQTAGTDPDQVIDTTQSTVTIPDVADGQWWFHVRAVNGSGLWSQTVHYRVRIDVTAADLTSLSSSSHPDDTGWYPSPDVTYVWSASDHSGIAGYSIVLDQTAGTDPDQTVDTTAASRTYQSLSDGTWWFHVRAKNGSGLWGGTSHVKVNIDKQAPTAPVITSTSHPDQNVWSTNDDPAWTWTANATSGVAGYSWTLDQNPSTTPDNVSEGTATGHAAGHLADGTWWLHVRAVSNAGVWGGTSHYRVQIDDTPPAAGTVTSSSHPDQQAWYPNNDPALAWSYTDHAPIDGYSYVLDQTAGTVPDTTVDTTATTLNPTDLADGVWWLHVRGRNASGLWSTTTHYKLNIDVTPPAAPDVVSTSHPDPDLWSTNDDPTFLWTASDTSGIVGYSWSLTTSATTDPDTVVDGTGTSVQYTDVADGTRYFHIRALNGAGLWSTTTHYRIRIDDTPPESLGLGSSTHPSASSWYPNNTPALSWSGDDISGITGYSWVLDQSPTTTPDTISEGTTTSTTYPAKADGTWYFHVRARNGAGLWGSTRHRQINIDTVPPEPPTISSSTHPDQARWYTKRDATLSWTVIDRTSGVNGYSWVLNRSAGTIPDTTSEGTGTSMSRTGLTDGTWHLHVRARDRSGLWSQTSSYRVNIVPVCTGTTGINVANPAGVTMATGRHLVTGSVPEAGTVVTIYRDTDGGGRWSSSDDPAASVTLAPNVKVFEQTVSLTPEKANCFFVRARRQDGTATWGPTAVPVIFDSGIAGGGTAGGTATGEDDSQGFVPGQLALRAASQDVDPSLLPGVVRAVQIFPDGDDGILERWWYLEVADGTEIVTAELLAASPSVDVVELVPKVTSLSIEQPVDRYYTQHGDFNNNGIIDDGDIRPQIHWMGQNGINVVPAWRSTNGGSGTRTIAVVDSGVTAHIDTDNNGAPDTFAVHPELAGKLAFLESDCVSMGRNCAATNTPRGVLTNHGTGVAGIAAAQTDTANNWPAEGGGVAGVGFGTRFLSYRVLTDDHPDRGECWSVADDFCWAARAAQLAANGAAQTGVGVINLSLGGPRVWANFEPPSNEPGSHLWQDVVNFAGRRGVSVVASAGNPCPRDIDIPDPTARDDCNNREEGTVGAPSYPGASHGVVNVAALDTAALPDEHLAHFSRGQRTNQGPFVDISAPGTDLGAPAFGGHRFRLFPLPGFRGTSGAAPQVAAGVALLTSTQSTDVEAWQRPPLRAEHRILSAARPFKTGLGGMGRGTLDLGMAVERRAVRLSGPSRFDTAVEISRETYPGGNLLPGAVVLAAGSDAPGGGARFADALASAGLAGVVNGPTLLVSEEELMGFGTRTTLVPNEIVRLLGCPARDGNPRPGPSLFIVGGESSISAAAARQLDECFDPARDVRRIAGGTRYTTAVQIGQEVVAGRTGTFDVALTSGENYPDAMVMSAWAVARRSPLLLTTQAELPTEVADFLRVNCQRIGNVWIAGGTNSVGSTPLAQARAAVTSGDRCTLEWRGSDPVKRIAGASRYATAQAVATTLFTAPGGRS